VGLRGAVGAMGNHRPYRDPFLRFFRGRVKPPQYCSSLLLYLHLDASRLRLFDSWNA
jgi:hypothetical protein